MKRTLQTLLTFGALTSTAIYADTNLEIQINQSNQGNNPLMITFNMRNNSEETIKIFKSSIPFDGEIGKNVFDIRDENHPLTYTGRVIERMHEVNEENFLYLDSGESYETTVNLATLYNFTQQNREYDITFNSSVYVAYENQEKEHLALHSNSLDIEASVNRVVTRKREQTYESSCNQEQQNLLNQALNYAENIAVNSANILHTSNANNTEFREWFGSGDYNTVTTNFDNISSVLSKNIVNFDCGCESSYIAYVYPSRPYNIHLCSGFWRADMQGTDSKAGTIIHEVSHFNVVANTSDHAYGQSEARGLAQNTPAHATSNADNHEYFAEPNLEAMIVAPTELTATELTTTTAQLTWADNSNNERGFEIFKGQQKVGDVGEDETSFQITGLETGHSYSYLVRAVGANSTISTTADVSFVSQGTGSAIPTAPTTLQASNIQQTEALLTWSDNSNNEEGFRVYQGEVLIATLGINVNQYQLLNLNEATEYNYSIKAYNAQGESSATAISFQTAQPLTATTPINLGDRVNGRWNQNNPSTHRENRYAEFYTFTLEQDTHVIINLESTDTDTYLYLLSGDKKDSPIVTRDDDGGTGRNSKIERRLTAGTYTLEATTYSASQSGAFIIEIKEDNEGVAPIKTSFVRTKDIKETSAFLYWGAVATDEGFKLYLDGVEIATTDMGVNGYTLSGLSPNREYTFSVKAFNRYGISEAESVTFTTQPIRVEALRTISMDSKKTGKWVSTKASTHRAGKYAQYYTFTLTEATTVAIDLTSSQDSFLYLLAGNGENGSILASDDDGGQGRNSKIIKNLEAGTYTLEATTFANAKTGSFIIQLGHKEAVSTNSISLNETKSGQWVSTTTSTHRNYSRAYAQYYTFTLTETKNVVIDLESSVDTFIYLLNGNGIGGSIITRNDDGGAGTNSRIQRRLNAGTYTIEATTFGSFRTGTFNVSLR